MLNIVVNSYVSSYSYLNVFQHSYSKKRYIPTRAHTVVFILNLLDRNCYLRIITLQIAVLKSTSK